MESKSSTMSRRNGQNPILASSRGHCPEVVFKTLGPFARLSLGQLLQQKKRGQLCFSTPSPPRSVFNVRAHVKAFLSFRKQSASGKQMSTLTALAFLSTRRLRGGSLLCRATEQRGAQSGLSQISPVLCKAACSTEGSMLALGDRGLSNLASDKPLKIIKRVFLVVVKGITLPRLLTWAAAVCC